MERKLVSIITPVYNEEDALPEFYKRLSAVLQSLQDRYRFEIVITDNRSDDNTFSILRELAAQDERIRAYRFSRNFGYQRSIWTGYSLCRGEAAIELDVDLQDPPELLNDFLAKWEEGYQVIYGVRVARQEERWRQELRRFYYRLIREISEDDLPADAGDFMLLDRKVLDHVKGIYDPNIYIRGSVFAIGFRRFPIPYARADRTVGVSKFPLAKMLRLGIDGIIRHSDLPLRISSFVGISLSVTGFLAAIGYLIGKFAFDADWPPGFATIVIIQLMTIGILALGVGILGEYLLRIYVILRRQPMSVIDEMAGSDLGTSSNRHAPASTPSAAAYTPYDHPPESEVLHSSRNKA